MRIDLVFILINKYYTNRLTYAVRVEVSQLMEPWSVDRLDSPELSTHYTDLHSRNDESVRGILT